MNARNSLRAAVALIAIAITWLTFAEASKEKPAEAALILERYKLTYAHAGTAAEVIEIILGGPREAKDIKITADKQQNAVEVLAPKEVQKTVRELIRQIEQPGEPVDRVGPPDLSGINAAELRKLLFILSEKEAQTPARILEGLRSRHDAVENLRIEAAWEEFENGKPSAWEEGTIVRDKLGQIRVRYHHGPGALPPGGQPPRPARLVDNLFNGEISVSMQDDPGLDRLGKPLRPGVKTDPNNRYRSVLIHDGKFAGGLDSHRNPFTFMDITVMGDLSALLADKKPVAVEPVTGQPGVYELRYEREAKHRVRVDVGKGWVVTEHERSSLEEKWVSRKGCDYQRSEGGLWVPTTGHWRNWGKTDTSSTPALEWRFKVHRVAVNDPRFDERVFDIRLEREFSVYDTRLHCSYHVEKDFVSGGDLTRLAYDALAAQSARQRTEPSAPTLAGPPMGRVAPDFTIETLDGKRFSLRQQQGKYVLLHFWAARLPLDPAELSILKDLRKKFEGEGRFAMLGLCVGDREEIQRVAQEKGISWPQARIDAQFEEGVGRGYRAPGEFGMTILLGPDGKVLFKRRAGVAAMDPTVAELLR